MKSTSVKMKALELIKNADGISRIELAKELDITPAGIGKIVNGFLNKGIIKEYSEGISTGGRKPLILRINEENIGKILGISLAPRFIQISVGDINGKIFKTKRYSLKKRLAQKENNIFKAVEVLIKRELRNEEITIISVIINGMVDSEAGISIFSPHYNWKNIKLKELLEKKFNKRVFIENDVRGMALTEKIFGSCREKHNFVVLNIGDGVGGSIFLNDSLYQGYGSMSGELGHMVVKRNSTEKCSCGKRGCLETEVSNVAVIKKVISQIKLNNYSSLKNILNEKGSLDIGDIINAVKEKDMLTLNIMNEAIYLTAHAIDGIISVINPEKIILFGAVFKSSFLFKTLVSEVKKVTLDEQNYEIKVSDFSDTIYELSPFAVVNYNIFREI